MFGLGAGELILIAVVALLFVGPDKLPAAAKAIGKGIRDLRRQTSDLTRTIEEDTQIGDAVKDLRSALRGDDLPPPRRPRTPRPPASDASETAAATAAATATAADSGASSGPADDPPRATGAPATSTAGGTGGDGHEHEHQHQHDGPVARGPATRRAPDDVRAMAGLTSGTLRDRAPATTRNDATTPDPARGPGGPGPGTGTDGSGSAHG